MLVEMKISKKVWAVVYKYILFIHLAKMICAQLVWSVLVWLGENRSNVLAVGISGLGSLYY